MESRVQIEVLARRPAPAIERAGLFLATVARYGFAVFFGATAIAKLASGEQFVAAVSGYGVPVWAGDVVASVVIVAEFALAAWLASSRRPRAALFSAAGVLLAFAGVVALAWWRGATGDCGCFAGVAESAIGPGAILRNAALAAIAINAAVVERPPARFNR